jgi:hypothetical protein
MSRSNQPDDSSPHPSPTPSPDPDAAAASSPASAPASSTSRRPRALAGGLVGDPGPAFDGKAAGDAPPLAAAPAEPLIALEWDEGTVRSILTAQGAVVHGLVGVADDDWIYLQHELEAIAPPLTRVLNRYDALRAAAGTGDELALMIGLGGYVSRSWMTRKAELALREEEEPEPVTGVRAPDGTGPPDAALGGPDQWQT